MAGGGDNSNNNSSSGNSEDRGEEGRGRSSSSSSRLPHSTSHNHRGSAASGAGGGGEESSRRDKSVDSRGRGEDRDVREDRSLSPTGDGDTRRDTVHTLYVSNISPRCSVSDIRRVFEDIGEVQDCRVVTNPVTRESRGFAFVTFRDPSNASVAIDRLDGKPCSVDSNKPWRVERAKRNKP
ncbi:dead deah box helicase domain-containing protein, partial [Cystoisospora suis]